MLKQRILLVEDDPDLAEVMVTVLREEGYVLTSPRH
jgi:CheY-like chemotaxis protein